MYRILSPVALFVLGCLGGIRAVGIVSLFCSYQLNPGYLGSHLFFTWISNTRCSMGYLIEVVGFSIRELLCNLKGAIFVWEIKSTWKEKLSCIANSESQNPVYNYALLVDLLTYTYLTAMVIKQMKQFKEPSSQISPRTRSFQWIFYYSLLTTGKRYFAVCQNLRRVHYFGHTTKTSFAVCLQKNTRQIKNTRETLLFAVCQGPAHGKPWSSPCVSQ